MNKNIGIAVVLSMVAMGIGGLMYRVQVAEKPTNQDLGGGYRTERGPLVVPLANGTPIQSTGGTYTGPISVTDGVTTSTVRANSLFVSTSTANPLGLFNVDSSGNVSTSGTVAITGTTTINDATFLKGKVGAPRHIGSIANGGVAKLAGSWGLSVQGHYAYVTAFTSNALNVIDISNPTALKIISTTSSNQYLSGPTTVNVQGNYAYVNNYTGQTISIWDVSNPSLIKFVTSTVSGQGGTNLGQALGQFIQGNLLYVTANSGNTLQIYDISDPKNMKVLSVMSITAPAAIYVSGRYAYIVDNTDNRMYIVDVSDPKLPVIASSVTDATALGGPIGVFVQGKYAYVTADTNNVLTTVDVSNPASSTIVSSLSNSLFNAPYYLWVSGNYAYVPNRAAGGSGSIVIVDITSSTNQSVVGSISNGGGGAALNQPITAFGEGNQLFVTAQTGGTIEAIDLGGASIANTDIGTARVGNLQVLNYAMFDNAVNIKNGLSVGNQGLLLGGNFAMQVPSSTAYLINATNTLSFDHMAYFTASSTNGQNFIFDTANKLTANNTNEVMSVRNNTTELFNIYSNGGILSTGSSTIAANLNVGGTLGVSTTLIVASSTVGQYSVSTSGAVYMTNLPAPSGGSDDVMCYDTSGSNSSAITHQPTNCTISSARFKEHIQSLSPEQVLGETLKLRIVAFDYKDGFAPAVGEGVNGGGKQGSGFIAEEVAMIDPMLVSYTGKYTPADLAFEQKNYPSAILHKDGEILIPQTVDYARFSYLVVGSIQAQQKMIESKIGTAQPVNNHRIEMALALLALLPWLGFLKRK